MLDRDQLETFATVIEQQSFDRAAGMLNITRGAVSQRIRALEESLSTVLVVRDRPIAPTHSGEILLRHVKALRIMEASALQALRPTGTPLAPMPLAIAVNADSLATWFPDVLKVLLLDERVALEINVDDQAHTSALLSRGEVIGCIATSVKATDGFSSECLGAMAYRCLATPAYVKAHFPEGLSVKAVLSSHAILFNRKDALHDEFLQQHFGFAINHYARHYLPSPVALLDGVAMGAGYGLIPSPQADPLLESGALVDVCPGERVMVELFWHHWGFEPALAHGVSTLIVSVARRCLEQLSTPNTPAGDQISHHSNGIGDTEGPSAV